MEKEFEGKVALVTGAGSGIGAAVAIDLAKEGAAVVVSDISDELAQKVVDEIIAADGRAVKFVGDAANYDDVLASVKLAKDTYGKLDLAFNNAGITGPSGDAADLPLDQYKRLIDVNLNSVFYAMKAEIPEMLAAGAGSIVNTSSILGLVANPTSLPYTTAKHGLNGMTKAAAVNYATRGIRINTVNPGYIDTPLLSKLPKEVMDYLVSLHPMGRLGTSEEVSQVVLFLLSDRASFVTGSQYVVDGGYTAV
jgi:NAD(P)-dependent dehydrogenase (short-subunit alcohol dehydrogenase family)